MNFSSSNSLRKLRLPAYLSAAFLFAYPVIDTLLPALPMHMELAQWRYAATLGMAQTIINPLLAMLILLGVSIAAEDRVGTIVASSLGAIATLLLLMMTAMFALDAVQMHVNVNPAMRSRYTVMSIWTVVRFASAAVTMAIISVVSFRAVRDQAAVASQANSRGSILVGAARRSETEPDIAASTTRARRA